jgi:hypothetical protein
MKTANITQKEGIKTRTERDRGNQIKVEYTILT